MLHTFWLGNLRLVLDVQVRSGKQHTRGHAKAALGGPLDDDDAGLRAGLQLVELVLPSSRPNGAHGGHHEPAVATGRSVLGRQPRRTNHAIPHADAHGKRNHLKSLVTNIRKALQHVRVAAEQFKAIDLRATLLRYVSDRIAPIIGPFRPPAGLAASG